MPNAVPELIESNASRVPNTTVRLAPLAKQTIIVISGLYGSGKTSIVKSILDGASETDQEKAVIFNEKFAGLAGEDAAGVRGSIRTRALGGCACCLSYAELRKTVEEFVKQKTKLIIIEQSGVTDGSKLRASLVNLFGRNVDVRIISVVDAERLNASPAILHASVMGANAVAITHAIGNPGLAAEANKFVRALREGESADLVQEFPGQITPEFWGKTLFYRLPPSMAATAAVVTPEELEERERLRDRTEATVIMLHPNSSKESLKQLLGSSPIPIDRAKGWMQLDGKFVEVHFERKDHKRAVIAFGNPTDEKPALYDGKPHLWILSNQGAPPSEHFLSVGIPNFSPREIEYYLSLYPASSMLKSSLESGFGVPVHADGDALAHQIFQLTKFAKTFPPEIAAEFKAAFVKVIDKFVAWRLEVFDLLDAEARAGKTPDFSDRCVSLAYTLCWSALKYGRFLQEIKSGLPLIGDRSSHFDKIKARNPARLLFKHLGSLSELAIDGSPKLTDERINDLVAFALFGQQYATEPLTKTDALAGARALKSLCASKADPIWTSQAEKLLAGLESQLS